MNTKLTVMNVVKDTRNTAEVPLAAVLGLCPAAGLPDHATSSSQSNTKQAGTAVTFFRSLGASIQLRPW